MTDRAKTNRYASDDDADSLLADILDSTEARAQAEEAELARSLVAKRNAEDEAKAEAHATRLASRQAKLEQELVRQGELAKRRTMRMEALNPTPVAVEPAPVEQTPSLDEAAIRRQIAEEVRSELRAIAMTPMPAASESMAPAPRSRTGIFAAAAAVLIAGSVGVGAFTLQNAYKPDTNPYAKAVFAPMDREVVALEVGSMPIPKPEPEAVETPTPKPKRVVKSRTTPAERKPTSVFSRPTGQSDAAASLDKFNGILDTAEDPFAPK